MLVNVRSASIADAEAIARVHVLSWQGAYAGLLPESFLRGLSVERRAQFWKHELQNTRVDVFVAEDSGGRVVGFVSLGPSRDEDAPAGTGEILTIYVLPEEWGKGHGRRLMEAVVDKARRRGFAAITLWVLEGNERAKRFYSIAGFTPDGAAKSERIQDSIELHEVRYRLEVPPGG